MKTGDHLEFWHKNKVWLEIKLQKKITRFVSEPTHEAIKKSTTSAKIYETSVPMEILKERYILQKRWQNIIDELKLL